MRIVIVGATGNVGTALLRRIRQADQTIDIVGVSRNGPDRQGEPFEGIEWHSIDISETESIAALREVFGGADVVVHLAWAIRPNRDHEFLRRTNVDGSTRVFEAALDAEVPHLVYASSVGAYGDGRSHRYDTHLYDEHFPTNGTPASHYAAQKAEVESILDRVDSRATRMIVSRLRPALIFQPEAAPEIRDYFFGALVPRVLFRGIAAGLLPLFPWPPGVITQALHTDDVADAYWRVIDSRARGAFNVASDPPVTAGVLRRAARSRRWLPIPLFALRGIVAVSYALRLQPTDPGWVDMAVRTPLMDTTRARDQLGWRPRHSSFEVLRGVVNSLASTGGLGNAEHRPTSPLQ